MVVADTPTLLRPGIAVLVSTPNGLDHPGTLTAVTDRGRRCTVDMQPVEGSAYDSPTGLTVAWPANRVRAAGTTLAAATPVEIDVALAALDSWYRKARYRLDLAVEVLHAAVGDRRTGSKNRGPWLMSDAQALEAARRSDRTDPAIPQPSTPTQQRALNSEGSLRSRRRTWPSGSGGAVGAAPSSPNPTAGSGTPTAANTARPATTDRSAPGLPG
uniref:hypothetical protein n=1 Tax=Kitasatospora sp. NBC_01519 TaxID=2903576 RepID=UPI002F91A493